MKAPRIYTHGYGYLVPHCVSKLERLQQGNPLATENKGTTLSLGICQRAEASVPRSES